MRVASPSLCLILSLIGDMGFLCLCGGVGWGMWRSGMGEEWDVGKQKDAKVNAHNALHSFCAVSLSHSHTLSYSPCFEQGANQRAMPTRRQNALCFQPGKREHRTDQRSTQALNDLYLHVLHILVSLRVEHHVAM